MYFNVERQSIGWLLTSHIVAIVALFVACFAITGYINFRNQSIPPNSIEGTEVIYFKIKLIPGQTNHPFSVTIPGGHLLKDFSVASQQNRNDFSGATLEGQSYTSLATDITSDNMKTQSWSVNDSNSFETASPAPAGPRTVLGAFNTVSPYTVDTKSAPEALGTLHCKSSWGCTPCACFFAGCLPGGL